MHVNFITVIKLTELGGVKTMNSYNVIIFTIKMQCFLAYQSHHIYEFSTNLNWWTCKFGKDVKVGCSKGCV